MFANAKGYEWLHSRGKSVHQHATVALKIYRIIGAETSAFMPERKRRFSLVVGCALVFDVLLEHE
jgi:hypothetical protein